MSDRKLNIKNKFCFLCKKETKHWAHPLIFVGKNYYTCLVCCNTTKAVLSGKFVKVSDDEIIDGGGMTAKSFSSLLNAEYRCPEGAKNKTRIPI